MKKFTIILGIVFLQISLFAQVPTNGLVGYWSFSGNANDESGNFNNGTVTGAVLTTDRFGNANSAYSFDGNDKIEIANSSILNFNDTTSFSLNCWIELSQNLSGSLGIITKGAPDFITEGAWQLLIGHLSSSAVFAEYGDGSVGAAIYGSQNLFTSTGWHFLTVVLDKSNNSMSLYIDDVLEVTTTNTTIATASAINNYPMRIGLERNSQQYFIGKIDDIRIYNRALNLSEISALYNEGLCYETITVTDTLIINANITGYNPVTFNNTIKIYPNPTSDHIYIDVDNNSMGYELKIINTLSQTVFETTLNQSQYNIDLNSWTGNGTYFVQFYDTSGNLIDVKKIIIQ